MTPSKIGMAFTPVFRSYTPLTGNQINQDFVGTSIIFSITIEEQSKISISDLRDAFCYPNPNKGCNEIKFVVPDRVVTLNIYNIYTTSLVS